MPHRDTRGAFYQTSYDSGSKSTSTLSEWDLIPNITTRVATTLHYNKGC